FRNPLLQQLDQCHDDLLRLVPLDEMEVGTRVCSAHVWHLAPANPVRVGNNSAVGRLPEDFSETHNWYDPAFYQVMEQRSRPTDGSWSTSPTRMNPARLGTARRSKCISGTIHHRGFINDQKTASERI